MSTETTTYNVYRVRFTQKNGLDHIAISLVPAQNADQTAGRFYHVIGAAAFGMTYKQSSGFRFGQSRSFKDSTLQFQISAENLKRFEEIAAKCPPPHNLMVLTKSKAYPPERNCASWVDEVLAEAKSELTSMDPAE